MAAPKKTSGSKGPQRVRMYEGKIIKPTLYVGSFGRYMAATLNDQILKDSNGRPLEFRQAGELVWN
ncbi:MAG: hypothetical protein ACXW2E_01725 [Nitrososphaeraceae archaeon]